MNRNEARELREQRAKLIADARAAYEASQRTKEDDAKLDQALKDADDLKAKIDRVERLEAAETETRATAKPPAGAVEGTSDTVTHVQEYRTAHKRARGNDALKVLDRVRPEVRSTVERLESEYWLAMKRYLVGGDANLSPEDRAILNGKREEFRSLGVGSILNVQEYRDMGTGGGNALQGAGGGYFVPVGFVDRVEEAMKWYGDMLQSSTIMPTATGQPLPYPTDNDTTNTGELIAENTQVSSQDVSIGNITFGAYKFSTKLIKVSIELLQDSAFDLETYLSDKFGIRIGRSYNSYFTVGAGVSQPKGIITAATAGPTAVGSSGNTGGAETGATSIGTDDLVELEHSVDKAYRRGAAFMAHDSTIKLLKKLKDKYGRPIWLPGLAVQSPDTILDYRYFTNNDMATVATTNKTVLFGQLQKYLIRQVKELAILRLNERFADYGQVAFIGFARADGNLLDAGTHPVKYLVQA